MVDAVPQPPAAHPGDLAPAELDTTELTGGAVHVLTSDDETRILLTGEIDADLAGEFTSAIHVVEGSQAPVVLDLRHVHFMDSFGVAFVSRIAGVAPGRVRVCRVPPSVRFLLEVTHTDDLVTIDED